MWVFNFFFNIEAKKKNQDLPVQYRYLSRYLHFIHSVLTVTEVRKERYHKSLASVKLWKWFFIYLTLFNLTDFNELRQSEERNNDCFK